MVTLDMPHKYWNKWYKKWYNPDILNSHKYSEHGEDGIIELVFTKFKPQNKVLVDVGAFGERSSNTYKLLEEGWSGVLIEKGDDVPLMSEMKERWVDKSDVKVLQEYVSPVNLEKLLSPFSIPKNFDFLSIDVDSFEYEIWKNLKEYQPNLVCIEINQFETNWKKIDYDPSFSLNKYQGKDISYGGATIGLMNRLAEEKGYDYLCWDVSNVFYLRKDFIHG